MTKPKPEAAPMDTETPRRDVMRGMGLAGAALLGALGMRTTATTISAKGGGKAKSKDKGKGQQTNVEKKRNKGRGGARIAIVLGDEKSFQIPNLPGGGANSAISRCPSGSLAVGGTVLVDAYQCHLVASTLTEEGNGWLAAGGCPGGEESEGRVRAICLQIG